MRARKRRSDVGAFAVPLHDRHQRIEIERLVEDGRVLAHTDHRIVGRRDDHPWNPRPDRILANDPHERGPAHARQRQVDEHHRRPLTLQLFQRLPAVAGADGPAAERGDRLRQGLRDDPIVIDDQHGGTTLPWPPAIGLHIRIMASP
jgi:hypothetical protein